MYFVGLIRIAEGPIMIQLVDIRCLCLVDTVYRTDKQAVIMILLKIILFSEFGMTLRHMYLINTKKCCQLQEKETNLSSLTWQ